MCSDWRGLQHYCAEPLQYTWLVCTVCRRCDECNILHSTVHHRALSTVHHHTWCSWSTALVLGDLYSPLPAGGSPLQPRVAHWDLYFNHKYAHPAPPAWNTLFLQQNQAGTRYYAARPIWMRSLQVGSKNGHNGRPPGVAILLFVRHNLCNSIFSQCPTEKIGGGKKEGAKVPRGPLLAGDMPEFSFQGTPPAGTAHDSVRGHVGAHPTPLGPQRREICLMRKEGHARCPRLPDPGQGSQENCSHDVTFPRVPSNP